ncbi:adenylate/guanylate cyclase domain-containing protein [Caballeronia novacaledonica]|uniref:Adenylate/guanylate cyclase domain-containing protein n=1 Tax=Caballeronia novacaledonica TaxID=1544861 RepID=A0AA37IP63_9BURK|nr:adenylate/guanylate cyclase domain-containing protein [Caballeronia novacaledonica]GJH29990.1 adenylate/guanylate cyclase domain-containing protein [Caballeronia novacaledonica]
MDLEDWLGRHGLDRYTTIFRSNDISLDVLPDLTDADLKGLGLSLGDRRRMLRATHTLRLRDEGLSENGAARLVYGEDFASGASCAERRYLTVAFVDLVGSTALSTRLDVEDYRELIADYESRIAAVIEKVGGFVALYYGDGVLAYFGYPQAHEDDPERAIHAGLESVAVVGGLKMVDGTALRIRVGIATGLVVVGDVLGSGPTQQRAVVLGQTPNLAARLQALAEPDSVVIADATHRLVGDLFDCIDLGAVEVKGFVEPVRAYRVLGRGSVASRFEALHTKPPTLVGREEETALLLCRWERARGGEGSVVVLSGEPGIGKSRLVAGVMEGLGEKPYACLRYFCSPGHEDSPLLPVIAQLERMAGFVRGDPPGGRLDKLRALLAPTSPRPEELTLIAELLSLRPDDRDGSRLVSDQKRARTFEALMRWVERLSNRRPVLMVFEDVHWIDPSSLELLRLTVESAARLPLMLLITCRPEFKAPWTDQPHVEDVRLQRFNSREAAELVRQITGSVALSDALVAEVVERTDGIPLFVEELTKALLETGTSDTVSAVPLAAMTVPATLHASLMARLDRLDASTRITAQAGAVIGREFSYELLAAVADLDEGSLAAAVERLVEVGLAFRRGDGAELSYCFKHALVRDVAYGTLLREQRRRLHAAVACTFEETFPELAERTPELLAHHLTEAGEPAAAMRYWLEAGRRAAGRSADREAVSHLRNGLRALAGLPASIERDRAELDFQLAIGTPLIALSAWSDPAVAAAYERAGEICESLGETGRLVRTLFGLYSNRIVRGQTRMALRLAERCERAAAGGRDPVDRLLAHRAKGTALMQLGALGEARLEFEAIPALYVAERDGGLAAQCITDPCASGLSLLALVLWKLGFVDQARRTAAEGSRRAAELRHANTTGHLLCHAGAELAQFLRDESAARRYGEAARTLAAEHDMPMWRGYGLIACGWAAAEAGRFDEGVTCVRQGAAELDALGAVFHRPYHLCVLAEIHGRFGDPDTGLQILNTGYEEIARTDIHLFEAELHRLEGELRLRAQQPTGLVEACFAEALAIARRQQAKSSELRVATSLARLQRKQGRRAEARGVLASVFGWFTEGFDTRDLIDARALLDEL